VDARLLGPRPQAEVFDLYRAADVVVQPAVAPEPFSRVPLEAAAFGRPVVASDAGGNAEAVVDGVTGLLVPRDNAAALARALGRLLADEPLRAKLGEQARAHVAQAFGAEAAARALLAAYGSALR
jgi:D-inositol-3-phosphate glycosyltransferase